MAENPLTEEDYAAFRRELVKHCQEMREMHDLVSKCRRAVNLVLHPESQDDRGSARAHDAVMTSLDNSLVMLPQFKLWANSVHFGGRGHAVKPREVVMRLGMHTIKDYLDNVHYFDKADGYYPPEVYGLSFNEILIHQVLCHEFLKVMAARIGEDGMRRLFPGKTPTEIQDDLHTLGFEHDFGKLLILKTYSQFKERFESELGHHVARRHLGTLDFEMALFQTHHIQAYHAFGKLQKMDEKLLAACGQHHETAIASMSTGSLLLILAHQIWKSDFSFSKEGDTGDILVFENPPEDCGKTLALLKDRDAGAFKGFDARALADVRVQTYARVKEVLTKIHGIQEANDRVYGVAAHEHAVERMPRYLRNHILAFANEPEPRVTRRQEVMNFITQTVKFLEILYSKVVYLETFTNPVAEGHLFPALTRIRKLYRDSGKPANGEVLGCLQACVNAYHGLAHPGKLGAGVHGALTGRLGRGEKGPQTLLRVLDRFVFLRNQMGDHRGHRGDDFFMDHLVEFRKEFSQFLSLTHPFFFYYDLLFGQGTTPREKADGGGYFFENTFYSLVSQTPFKARQDHPGGKGRVGIYSLKDGGSFDLDPFMISTTCPQCKKPHVMTLERLERGIFVYDPHSQKCGEVKLRGEVLLDANAEQPITSKIGRKIVMALAEG